MRNSPLRSANPDAALAIGELQRFVDGWILDSEYRQLSPSTMEIRRGITYRLMWFLDHKKLSQCGTLEVRAFLNYVANGHKEPGGRWNNPRLTEAVRPRTVRDFYGVLKTMFHWIVAEGYLDDNPMATLRPPVSRADQIQPFSPEQVNALLNAAKHSRCAKRDQALILFMLDSGIRVSELCNLKMKDVDIVGKRCIVLGKGNKHRNLYFGRATSKALWAYMREEERKPDDPLFITQRRESFTRSGLLQLVDRLGHAAKLEAVRCSPHTFRHTFAVNFLRAGGNVFSLQHMLGHTQIGMTQRYVALAQADVQAQHQQFSPVDRMKGGRK